jgi:outer membrane biosynthesis protein TonB
MRKTVAFCLLLLLLGTFLVVVIEAAPSRSLQEQEPQAVITSPRDRAVVRDKVSIQGTATHPQFWKYEVAYGPEPNPGDQWILIGAVHETQVVDNVLETWDTTLLPDGNYSLRLRVVRRDGNYDEYFVRQISVANTQPTDTPTPEVTPTPTNTPTPLPPTPTIIIELPVLPSPTPRPVPTVAQVVRPTPTPASSFFNIELPDLGGAFCWGAGAAAFAFLLVGLLALLRRLFSLLLRR